MCQACDGFHHTVVMIAIRIRFGGSAAPLRAPDAIPAPTVVRKFRLFILGWIRILPNINGASIMFASSFSAILAPGRTSDMLTKTAILLLGGLILAAPVIQPAVQAQRPSRGEFGGRSNLPRIGDSMPDVSVFDSNGKPFSLRLKTKGRHAVIVFGCLT